MALSVPSLTYVLPLQPPFSYRALFVFRAPAAFSTIECFRAARPSSPPFTRHTHRWPFSISLSFLFHFSLHPIALFHTLLKDASSLLPPPRHSLRDNFLTPVTTSSASLCRRRFSYEDHARPTSSLTLSNLVPLRGKNESCLLSSFRNNQWIIWLLQYLSILYNKWRMWLSPIYNSKLF